VWRVPIDQEVEEELAFHLEMRRREGKPLDAAEIERVRRACLEIARKRDREMRLTQWLDDAATARRVLGGRNPIGMRIALQRVPQRQPIIKEIVGVARSTSGRAAEPQALQVYMPLRQYPTGDVYLVAEAATEPAEALTPLVRAIVARHVLRLVLRSAATMIAAGTLIGLALAFALSKTIAAFLFGVQPIDPVTFLGAVLLLVVTAALAGTAPAWRAAHVDPVVAFRND
jgi:hypothetical protein